MQTFTEKKLKNSEVALDEIGETMLEFRGTQKRETKKMDPKKRKKGDIMQTILVIIMILVIGYGVGKTLNGAFSGAATDAAGQLNIEAFKSEIG